AVVTGPSGELGPALAWRDDLGEMPGRSTAFGRCRQGESTPGPAAASVGRWTSPAPTTRTAVRGAPPFREKLVSSSGRQKQRQGDLSLPLLTYSAPGGLRQDPGRTAESSAEATTCGNGARRACVVVDVWGTR